MPTSSYISELDRKESEDASTIPIMLDQEDLDRLQEAEHNPNKFVVSAPTDRQKLGATTVICLILNRTIGGCSRS